LTYESTFSKIVGASGIWNVRVKDACGEAVTQQITISDPYPSNLRVGGIRAWSYPSMTCDEDSIYVWMGLYSTSLYINHTTIPTEGVFVDVYLDEDGTCEVEGENYVKTIHITPDLANLDFIVPKDKKLIFVTRTPCGAETIRCYDGEALQVKDGWAAIISTSKLLVTK